jgi:hypothetical protein
MYLEPPDRKKTYEAAAKARGDYLHQYGRHPEAKSLGPDGNSLNPP